MFTSLDWLIIVFMFLSMLTLLSLSLMFLIRNRSAKKVFFYIVSGLGLYVSSEVAMDAALERFIITIPTYFLCGIMDVLCGALRALGKSVTSMIISLIGACGFRILWLQTVFKIYSTWSCIFISGISFNAFVFASSLTQNSESIAQILSNSKVFRFFVSILIRSSF